jgi:hypothetical protein
MDISSITNVPRRDLLILPLVGLVTVLVFGTATEFAARSLMPEDLADSCAVKSGPGFRPGCVSVMKAAEGPYVRNSYNECGYRTEESCLVKPGNGLRIAVVGSSVSRGFAVSYQDSFAARASVDLSHACKKAVQFQNIAIDWPRAPDDPRWETIAARIDDALRLHPDTLLLSVSSWDLGGFNSTAASAPQRGGWKAPLYDFLRRITEFVRRYRDQSRAILAVRHILYLDDRFFTAAYLRSSDQSDYLRQPLDDAWEGRLAMFDRMIGVIAQKAGAAEVPVVTVFAPEAAQVLLARMPVNGPGLDPRQINRAIELIAGRHGARSVDTLTPFTQLARPAEAYYRVNRHPNAEGHRVIATAVEDALLQSPPFAACEAAH